MQRIKKIYLLALVLCSGFLFGQEQLLPLQIDSDLHNFHQQNKASFKNVQLEEPMFLPFFDDFNQDSYRPDESLWLGENVYVNKKFQLFPPDLGVATFDAMDGEGQIHSQASQYSFPADTLTSQPIRLDSILDPTQRPLLVRDSIYLSFYYQPQGRGNAPEKADILSLEFYAPTLDKWFPAWDTEGMKLDSFLVENDSVFTKQVFISITDSARYYHSGFQFRFHNHASLAGSSQPDWQSNCDQWNIDLVYLDKDRTVADSSYRKIAFVNEPPVMIKRYKSMPYRQYRNDPTNSMEDTIKSVFIRNLDDQSYVGVYSYKISNQSSQDSIYDGGSLIVLPTKEETFVEDASWHTPRVISYFSIYPDQQKTYEVTHVVNDIGLTGIGDTAVRKQVFSNYYAYDDGTAEAGYGMAEKNSKAAVQFKLNTKDTLTRVNMYFNPTLTSANEQYFYLMVWKNLEPEELLYKKRFKVNFTDGMYNFYTFDLDTNLILANEFYLGFQQITDDNLNIGFDYSLDSRQYLYYNIGVGWYQSIYSGSLMMRPEFGVNELTGVESIKPEKEKLAIYPNPLNGDYLNIDYADGNASNSYIEIYNLTGQMVYSQPFEAQIRVTNLNNGIYVIRLVDVQNSNIQTQKLIIRK